MINILQPYWGSGVLIDTNILLLLFVGAVDPKILPQFKRTRQFAPEDYETARRLLQYFPKAVTTPNILTEVSNLAGQLRDDWKQACFEHFAAVLSLLHEEHVPSSEIATTPAFHRLGLTDAGIIHLAASNYLVLTDDWPLSGYLESLGADVLNFNNIRTLGWSR